MKWIVLKRGLKRRCPRCGEGPLFRKWIHAYPRCPVCNVTILKNQGDIWIWIILTDRIPIGIGVLAIYFGWQSTNWIFTAIFFVALFTPLIATLRERQGLAIALDYLWRIHAKDPSDEIHDGRGAVINVSR